MPKDQSDRPPSDGPVPPGTPTHAMLEAVAREVARRLRCARPANSDGHPEPGAANGGEFSTRTVYEE